MNLQRATGLLVTAYRGLRHLRWRWIEPIVPTGHLWRSVPAYARFLAAWSRYSALPGSEVLRLADSYPCLFDAVAATPFDAHYFYQAFWATERIARRKASRHLDVGSDVTFVGLLSTLMPVVFVDIRPLTARLPRLTAVVGSVLDLPFSDGSVPSLSCLHVAEHVGLGRYGDPLNPAGTQLACAELARVLTSGGDLFFSMPVGRPRTCFNAHRIHSPRQVLSFFPRMELVEFSAVDDRGDLQLGIRSEEMETAEYSCGLFWLRRG